MATTVAQTDIGKLASLIDDARNVVVFTGAGISTESGIPDFRSPGGVWSRTTPVYFDDFVASEEARARAWRQKLESNRDMRDAAPNRGHRAVAELVASGKASCVITQNIDGLHQVSGVADDRVIELHGNGTYAHCLDCGKRYGLDPILSTFDADGAIPYCDQCRGIIKTATISFGQAMPVEEMERAERETLGCDLFIAIGSSLVVYPAAGFPAVAKQNGASLVILNRDPTDLDPLADLVVHAEIGPTLGAAVGVQ